MAYDYAAYQADRATMRFRGKTSLLTEEGLALKRARLAIERPEGEQPAIEAAHARLLTWVKSAAPVPVEPDEKPIKTPASQPKRRSKEPVEPPAGTVARDDPEQAAELAKAELERAERDRAELAQWSAELAGQLARHERRRGRFNAVRPGAWRMPDSALVKQDATAGLSAEVGWAAELTAQATRHERRRSRYPAVRPGRSLPSS